MTSRSSLQEKMIQYLCPPGNGVHTIHTAKEQKASLHRKLFGTDEPGKVKELWQNHLQNLSSSTLPVLLGVCSDNGGGILRGANWGPLFIRETFYNIEGDGDDKANVFDVGDIRVIPHLLLDHHLHPSLISNCRSALYENKNSPLPVSPLSITQDFAKHLHKDFPQKRLLALGGDHSVSFPLVSEFLKAKKTQNKKVAIIHFDAHTDLLQERLGIDICFGSWAYHVLQDLPSPDHLIQIGIRSSGKSKEHWESTLGVKQYWAMEVKKAGASSIAESILKNLYMKNIDEIYVSFDIDAIDSQYVMSTGTPEAGGLSPHEAMIILQELCDEFPLTGADLVEVAPYTLPSKNKNLSEPESTLLVANSICNSLIESMGEEENENL